MALSAGNGMQERHNSQDFQFEQGNIPVKAFDIKCMEQQITDNERDNLIQIVDMEIPGEDM